MYNKMVRPFKDSVNSNRICMLLILFVYSTWCAITHIFVYISISCHQKCVYKYMTRNVIFNFHAFTSHHKQSHKTLICNYYFCCHLFVVMPIGFTSIHMIRLCNAFALAGLATYLRLHITQINVCKCPAPTVRKKKIHCTLCQ